MKVYPAGTFADFADYVLKLARVHCRYAERVLPITLQCITRIYRYVGARMMHFNKNESKNKILKIP